MNEERLVQLLGGFKQEIIESIDLIRKDLLESKKEQADVNRSLRQEIERIKRERNIVIFGLKEEGQQGKVEDTLALVKRLAEDRLGIILSDLDVDYVRRIGSASGGGKTRPILLKLTTQRKKMEVLRSSFKLKGDRVFIKEDFPKEIQEIRKELLPKLREAKQKGLRAYINYNKLVIAKPDRVIIAPEPARITRIVSTGKVSPTPVNTPESVLNEPPFSGGSSSAPGPGAIGNASPADDAAPRITRAFKQKKDKKHT